MYEMSVASFEMSHDSATDKDGISSGTKIRRNKILKGKPVRFNIAVFFYVAEKAVDLPPRFELLGCIFLTNF